MLHLVVSGLWGVREESSRRVAERWVAFLGALESLDPDVHDWSDGGRGTEHPLRRGPEHPGARGAPDSDGVSVPRTVSAIRAFLHRANPEPDADSVGYSACLRSRSAAQPAPAGASHRPYGRPPEVSVRIRAGGSSEFVHGVCSVTLTGPDVNGPEADGPCPAGTNLNGPDLAGPDPAGPDHGAPPSLLAQRPADVLRALADAWDIDSGQVHTPAQHELLRGEFGLRDADPFCGRCVYLSANRAALVPRSLPGTLAPTDDGGVVVDLAKGTDDPDDETLLEANRALRAAGALDRLPAPYDRARW